jgi:polysaccharide export outer membrane protein
LAAYVVEVSDILLVESPRSLPDQPIQGEHLVRPDGTISLGLYGSVRVAGLTLDEARAAIEKFISHYVRDAKVNVDVYAYNSKYYYIIADGAGFGEQVVRLPFTGNETVLDAMAQIGGLPAVSSKNRIWIARPTSDPCAPEILPVDWNAIVQCGSAATNYQIFPGDRIYVHSDRLLAFDGLLSKITAPIERMLAVSMLSGFTVQIYKNLGRGMGFGLGGGFGGLGF